MERWSTYGCGSKVLWGPSSDGPPVHYVKSSTMSSEAVHRTKTSAIGSSLTLLVCLPEEVGKGASRDFRRVRGEGCFQMIAADTTGQIQCNNTTNITSP